MRHPSFAALLIGVTALVLADQASAQPPRPFVPGAWWKEYQKPLNLSADQLERIEKIFRDSQPDLHSLRKEIDTAEAELSRLIEIGADDRPVIKQSEHVESLRSSLNQQRTIMLVHMRAVLTPEQRTRLTGIREQWDRDHPQRGDHLAPGATIRNK
jgi:Spy/CpxP family protein refolding chaperone